MRLKVYFYLFKGSRLRHKKITFSISGGSLLQKFCLKLSYLVFIFAVLCLMFSWSCTDVVLFGGGGWGYVPNMNLCVSQVLLAVDYSVVLFHGRENVQRYLLTIINIVRLLRLHSASCLCGIRTCSFLWKCLRYHLKCYILCFDMYYMFFIL